MDGFAIVFLSKRGEGVMALSVQEAAPALQRGPSGVEVQILHHRLNRIGALLDCDGDFGSVTEGVVKEAQHRAALQASAIAAAATSPWIEAQTQHCDRLRTDGRRVGKGDAVTLRARWSRDREKKKL